MANVKEEVIVAIPDHSINSTIAMSTTSEGSISSDSVESRGSKRKHDSDSDDPHSKSCKTDYAPQSSSVVILEDSSAPTSKEMVQQSVKTVLQTWGTVLPVHPDHFLHAMLTSRGYETSKIPSMQMKQMRTPTMKQIMDYDNELVWAIRNSDLPKIRYLWSTGRSMSACNRFCESIVHMACRRADRDVIEFILSHGGEIDLVDDYGRTPLHDACWRKSPRFDVVTILMDKNIDLIRYSDARGSTPLKYCREEHWLHWCAYLYNQREKYWAPMPGFEESSKALQSAPSISAKAMEILSAPQQEPQSSSNRTYQANNQNAGVEERKNVDPSTICSSETTTL